MKTIYYRLLDSDYFGTIIKVFGEDVFRFDQKEQDWKKTGLMVLFYSDSSDKYGLYEEITENEVQKSIKEVS